MSPLEMFTHPMWQKPALVLLHFLWQGLAVALLVAIAVRIWGERGASIRHRCYVAGLLAIAFSPVVTYLLIDQPHALGSHPQYDATDIDVYNNGTAFLVGSDIDGVVADDPQIVVAPVQFENYQPGWRPWLLMTWLLGVCYFSARLLIGYGVLQRWKRHSRPLPADFRSMVEKLSHRLGMSRLPRVAVSKNLSGAMAMGIVRPLILLPASWLMELPPNVLEAVIAHELAHIQRRDLWVNLLARSVEALLFYHPAVWWLTGQIQRERELCCDEMAVAVTGRRAEYARALEFVAMKSVRTRQPVLATGLGGKKMALLDRVRHVLGMGHVDRQTGWWSAGAIALAVPLLFWGVSSAMRPAVADDEERDQERPAATEREGDERGEREGRERREGERERDGDRRERGEREGARERDGDRPRRAEGERDGDRERGERARRDGDRERPERDASREDLLRIITQLRREVAELRQHVRGPQREGERPRFGRPPLERPDGDGPPRRGPRDGEGPLKERPRDGDRPSEGDRPRDRDRPREGAAP